MEYFNYLDFIAAHWLTAVYIATGLFALYWLVVFVNKLARMRHLRSRRMVWLEITPPASIAKTPEATEQLFSVLHGLRVTRSFKDKLLKREPVMSFEIVSTRREGIRYLIQLEHTRSLSVQKMVAAYLPNAQVKEIEYIPPSANSIVEFKQTGHYVLPLTLTSVFAQHDPLSYVTSAMTRLEGDEQITLQLIVQPTRLREAERLSHRILGNENILQQVGGKGMSRLTKSANVATKGLQGLTDLTGEVYMGTAYGHKNYHDAKSKQMQLQTAVRRIDRPARSLSAFEQELMDTMHKKVTRPLFQANVRLLITSPHPKEHAASVRSALDGFSVPPYQSLHKKPQLPLVQSTRAALAERRLPTVLKRNALILSTAELASLYHVPPSDISTTDNLITSLSRTLPAPVSLKQEKALDVIIGMNRHHGIDTPIGLTEAERQRHIYVIGGTGNGKTTMLQYAIIQDIKQGKGVAIVDPHGDMAETILTHIPKERIKDVVYFNPDDLDHPFAMNLLELSPNLSGNDLLREKDMITESVVSIFRKIFSEDDSGGHRIEYVLRNTVHTALTIEGATLFTVLKLLQSPAYRRDMSSKLEDENLRDFWKNELGKAGDMQKVKMSAGITSKIGRFNINAPAKAILGQQKSTINFEYIINDGKILICNFSKGILGEDVSELFGITVLAKLQLASLRRARIKQVDRRPFYLYVDEFQNFATPSFVQMLSESRKYKLFLTMAEQSTSQQQDQKMVSVILANVGTVICFRTGNPQDERLLLPLFSPYIKEGEIANLSAFNFFARLSSVIAQEPLSGTTLLIQESEDRSNAQKAIAMSRKLYAKQPEQAKQKKSPVQPPVPARATKPSIIPPGG